MSRTTIRFSVNGREFHFEGDSAEASRKLDEFMGSVFSPLRNALHRSQLLDWRATLKFRANQRPTLQQVESRFRRLAKLHHPDKGGNREKFEAIQKAREAARLELSR